MEGQRRRVIVVGGGTAGSVLAARLSHVMAARGLRIDARSPGPLRVRLVARPLVERLRSGAAG